MNNHNDERICVVYFENKQGYVIVAPDYRHPTPEGFERKECHTLREVDKLTERMNRQDKDMFARLMAQDRAAIRRKHAEIRSKLNRRLLAVDCSPLEALFIRRMFEYMDHKEEELTKFEIRGYFQQREFDSKRACTENYGGHQTNLRNDKLSDRLASILTR